MSVIRRVHTPPAHTSILTLFEKVSKLDISIAVQLCTATLECRTFDGNCYITQQQNIPGLGSRTLCNFTAWRMCRMRKSTNLRFFANGVHGSLLAARSRVHCPIAFANMRCTVVQIYHQNSIGKADRLMQQRAKSSLFI